jgi:predicted transcriptional regulator
MRKDATITVRVPRPTRRRLESLAKREGRSLSQQVERLIEGGLDREAGLGSGAAASGSFAGFLAGEPVAEYGAFREVRTLLSAALGRGRRGRGTSGR